MKLFIHSQMHRLHRWIGGTDWWFLRTLYNRCHYLSMLWLKLNHGSKKWPLVDLGISKSYRTTLDSSYKQCKTILWTQYMVSYLMHKCTTLLTFTYCIRNMFKQGKTRGDKLHSTLNTVNKQHLLKLRIIKYIFWYIIFVISYHVM